MVATLIGQFFYITSVLIICQLTQVLSGIAKFAVLLFTHYLNFCC